MLGGLPRSAYAPHLLFLSIFLFYLFAISSSPLSSSLLISINLFPHLLSASSSGLLHHFSSSIAFPPPSTYSSSPLPLCAPFLSTHQSLALATPLRTYGMMDCRASGASKAKGHLLGALRCRGALGPAMQPRPHTSVPRHSHNMHTATPIIG